MSKSAWVYCITYLLKDEGHTSTGPKTPPAPEKPCENLCKNQTSDQLTAAELKLVAMVYLLPSAHLLHHYRTIWDQNKAVRYSNAVFSSECSGLSLLVHLSCDIFKLSLCFLFSDAAIHCKPHSILLSSIGVWMCMNVCACFGLLLLEKYILLSDAVRYCLTTPYTPWQQRWWMNVCACMSVFWLLSFRKSCCFYIFLSCNSQWCCYTLPCHTIHSKAAKWRCMDVYECI